MNKQNLPPMQQRADVRESIIGKATEMFHQKGLRSVTMDDIAHSLTMSKRTLYQIFADKEELLLACVKQHECDERKWLTDLAANTQNVLEFILRLSTEKMKRADTISHQFLEDIAKYPRVIQYIEQSKRENEDESVAFFAKGVEQGLFRKDINFRIVTRQLSSDVDTMVRNGLITEFPQNELFANTFMLYIRGCATLKGVQMIDDYLAGSRTFTGS